MLRLRVVLINKLLYDFANFINFHKVRADVSPHTGCSAESLEQIGLTAGQAWYACDQPLLWLLWLPDNGILRKQSKNMNNKRRYFLHLIFQKRYKVTNETLSCLPSWTADFLDFLDCWLLVASPGLLTSGSISNLVVWVVAVILVLSLLLILIFFHKENT